MRRVFFSPDDGGGTGGGSSPGAAAPPSSPAATPPAPSPSTTAAGGPASGGLEADAGASIIGGTQSNGQPPSFVRADGSFESDWVSKLPEDLAPARDSLKQYTNVVDLAKTIHSQNKLIGRKGVILPTQDSTPEELAAYHKTMGVPETPDGYAKEVRPAELPEGIQWSDEIAKSYFDLAHRHHIPAAAMKDLIALNMKQREFEQQVQVDSIMETKQQGLAHLRHVWGTNFDRNLGVAQRAAALAGVDANSYGWRDPEVVKGFVRLASMMGEDKLVGSGASLPAGAADLKSRAIDIMTNRANPLYQKYHDGDRETQTMVRSYLERASAGK
jgi:hypothetical protein